MKLIFTTHFKYRIFNRNLNIEHIKIAIKSPDEKYDAGDGCIKVVKKVDDKTIKVVYHKSHNKEEYAILTAYYLELKK